jgi:hypothetical protein
VDLDLSELLAMIPVRWETGIRRVWITREFLEIECAQT